MASAARMLIEPTIYSKILSKFPERISFCFAYGSAVKKQITSGRDQKGNMIDLVYSVEDSHYWHEENLKIHPKHYSALRYLGPKILSKFQENAGAKVYYNTLVPFNDVTIKYGVVTDTDLITDLLDWSDLYLAGRLHKPVEIIKKTTNSQLSTALQLNLQSAVHAALLLLPENFTEYDFYYTISNLSYAGDFRMTFGENKNKVQNIVKPQLIQFRKLYLPVVELLKEYVEFPFKLEHNETYIPVEHVKCSNYFKCSQDIHPMTKLHHLNQLPKCPQKCLVRFWNKGKLRQDTEDALRALAYDPDCGKIVEQCIKEIVWNSSVKQSLKGILTAGVVKSVLYSGKKLFKMIK